LTLNLLGTVQKSSSSTLPKNSQVTPLKTRSSSALSNCIPAELTPVTKRTSLMMPLLHSYTVVNYNFNLIRKSPV